MTDGNITRHLISYSVPLIFGNILQLTYNAVDSIVISKAAGESALAAVSSSNPIMTIVILGVSGVSIGASVLMSQAYGAGDNGKLKRELSTTIIAGAICSLAVFLIGEFLSPCILQAMNVPHEILSMADMYLRIVLIGFLFTFQYNIMTAALRSIGDARTPVIFLAVSSILNVILDILFVYSFHWGISGAAAATVISQALSAVLCFIHVYRHIPLLQIKKDEFTVDRQLLKETVKSGSITALQQSCQPIGKVLIQGVINAQGITAIAAFNAVCRVDDFARIPEQSIGNGIMTCTAQNYGAGNKTRVRETFRKGMIIELCYFPIICILTLLFKTQLMQLFAPANGKAMIAMGTAYLTVKALTFIMPGITNGMQGYFRGIGHMKITLAATIIQISIRTIAVFYLVPQLGITGEAYACLAGWLCMSVFGFIYYASIRNKI